MPVGISNQEWLNANSQRHYPLADDADGVSEGGDFAVPEDFIVELDLAVPTGLDVSPGGFFVKHIGAYATGYSVVIGYQPDDPDEDPVDVATALIARPLHTRNRVYALGGIGDFSDAVGKVVIGRLDAIDAQPPGFHTFSLAHGRLDPDAVRPQIRGVTALILVNNGQASEPLYGDVELVAGNNVQLVPSLVEGEDPVIRINAVRGEGTVDDCVCTGDTAAAPPLRRISGVAPTPDGDFFILGDKCLEVQAVANGIRLVDTCSKPCCGCPELEAITRDLERLRGEAQTVRSFTTQLRAAVDTMNLTVLSSVGGTNCIQC